MHRFFLKPETIRGDRFLISDAKAAHQIGHVLRLRPGEDITLLDNQGNEYLARIDTTAGRAVRGRVLRHEFYKQEIVSRKIILYQALLKKSNFELVLQKCTELGVSAFLPMITARTIKIKKEVPERWRDIVREAAEQSGRIFIPEIYEPRNFKQAAQEAAGKEDQKNFIAYEELARIKNHDREKIWYADNSREVGIFIGPEDGFSQEEVEFAKQNGIEPINLGPLILRAETAALGASALLVLT
jgi:16S rRNA (uracil1498-N3)-methyltransferase